MMIKFVSLDIYLQGNFIRIYPTNDKFKAANYQRLAEACARVFTGRSDKLIIN